MKKGTGVGRAVCANQNLETPNIFMASYQRLLSDIPLRFDSVNLAPWSHEVVTHKQYWQEYRKQNISHLNFNISISPADEQNELWESQHISNQC